MPASVTHTATDNCGVPKVDPYIQIRTDGSCANNYTLTRTWTAMDACNNTDTKSQNITVQDTTAPVIESAPGDTIVNICKDPLSNAPSLKVTDNCDPDKTVPAICCVDGVGVKRTLSAQDSRGNAATNKVQTIGFVGCAPEF
jgi:hypothetical protein